MSLSSIKRSIGEKKIHLLLVVACIILGVVTVLITRASSVTVAIEAEDGTPCNPSLVRSLSNGASKNKYVQFSSTACAGPTQNYNVNDWLTASTIAPINPAEPNWPAGTLGNFRFICWPSHMNYDDPIVYPGQQGRAHLHLFFGKRNLDYRTNTSNIASSGSGSCDGGPLNRTGYWIPALLDSNNKARLPIFTVFYYKSQGLPVGSIQSYPNGLRMINGNMNATSSQRDWRIQWQCLNSSESNIYPGQEFSVIPNCPAGTGNKLKLQFSFPQCGARNSDGTPVLDSADHKSHMAYQASGHVCPSSHPIPYPEVSLNMIWNVTGTNAQSWRLSSDAPGAPAGSSTHADWMMGWDVNIMNTFIQRCIREGRNSNNGNLCNGTSLKAVRGPDGGKYNEQEIYDVPPPGGQVDFSSAFPTTTFP